MVRMSGDHAFLHNPDTGQTATIPLTRKALPVGTTASILRQAGVTADKLRDLLA